MLITVWKKAFPCIFHFPSSRFDAVKNFVWQREKITFSICLTGITTIIPNMWHIIGSDPEVLETHLKLLIVFNRWPPFEWPIYMLSFSEKARKTLTHVIHSDIFRAFPWPSVCLTRVDPRFNCEMPWFHSRYNNIFIFQLCNMHHKRPYRVPMRITYRAKLFFIQFFF